MGRAPVPEITMPLARSLRRVVLTIGLALGLVVSGALALAPTPLVAQEDATVVFLVRHAERAEDGTSDPVISLPGWDRARLLADMMSDVGLTHIHTTPYRRTRGTGRPTADVTGLDMDVYDARGLSTFAALLRATPGRHLVLGHSNTTPELVAALGGDAGEPIDELEYDRLYIVTLTDDGTSTVLLRFGAPFER